MLDDLTLGLNWYLDLNARVMFNYIVAQPEGFDLEQIVQVRMQVTF